MVISPHDEERNTLSETLRWDWLSVEDDRDRATIGKSGVRAYVSTWWSACRASLGGMIPQFRSWMAR
jgi:hypothetical protein